MAFELPSLPYSYDALAPHIDARTMEIHHGKHHNGYTNKLNAALEGHAALQGQSIEALLSDLSALPDSVRNGVRNNGGGYTNHSLFWQVMSPNGGGAPSGPVGDAINGKWGGFEAAQSAFGAAAGTRFGSGWAWLVVDGNGELEIYSTPNQDSPISNGHTPILGLDVWEHAYYLNYQNRRPDYVKAFWNVVNWDAVNAFYTAARG